MMKFDMYGPAMFPSYDWVVSDFIVHAKRGDDIAIYGDGWQSRSFYYGDDSTGRLVKMPGSETGFAGHVDLGNPSESTMPGLAKAILSLAGSRSRLLHGPLPSNHLSQRQLDIQLAIPKLRWRPTILLHDAHEKKLPSR